MFKKITFISVACLVSACASTPEVIQQPQTASAPIPAPVIQAPEPVQSAPVQNSQPLSDLSAFEPAPVPGSMDDFIYQSGEDRVYFGYDRFDLNETSRAVLRKQAEWLKNYTNVSAVIAGHADERGTRNYNLALGARRADSVKDFLVSLGVNPRRLTSVSFGKERPLDARSNENGWAKNRNVHTNLTSGLNTNPAF